MDDYFVATRPRSILLLFFTMCNVIYISQVLVVSFILPSVDLTPQWFFLVFLWLSAREAVRL